MAVKLLFEDGDNTPSSFLLKQTHHGKYIYFSNGVGQLLNKAVSIKEADDIVYMFYDVSPNNQATVKGYKLLVDTLRQNKVLYKDMYVIPIICIEYHICKMFDKYNWFYTKDAKALEMIEKLVKTFDWNNISFSIKSDPYVGETLEHAYKNILSLLKMRCLRNEYAYDKKTGARNTQSLYGIFYEKDCACDRIYCGINCIDKLNDKAEKLYASLPLFIVETPEHEKALGELGITIKHLSNTDIKQERKLFYKMICANMGLPMFSINL